jgi:hypothetical protein
MLRTCASCGAVNRISAARLASTGRCGLCKGAQADLLRLVDGARVA